MAKNTKKRAVIYSNVKQNKKRAEEISKIQENQINLNDEVIIGLNKLPGDNIKKNKNSKKKNVKKSNQNNNMSKKNSNDYKNTTKKNSSSNSKKKRKIIRILKIFIIISFLLTGIIIFLKSSIFNIKTINVAIENNNFLTESQIKDLLMINVGQNMYSISKKKSIESIKNNPYVESVKIKRSIPDKLQIEVKERSIKFQLQLDNQYIYIDEKGIILEKSNVKKDCIIVTGFSTSELNEGTKLNNKDLEGLSAVLKILQEAENNKIKDYITSIDIENKNDYKLYFNNLGKIVHLGDTTSINSKFSYITKILEVKQDYEGEIFVNVDLNNGEYPYFREKV